MKRLGIISLFLTVTFVSHAVYHPLLTENKQWNYMHVHISYAENPPVEDKYSFSITIADTTLINGQVYYVIDNLRTSYAGQVYMREDTATQQVWILNNEYDKEQLVFNFNVSVGDTLRNVTFYPKENPMLDLSRAEYVVTHIGYTDDLKTIFLHAFVPYNQDYNPDTTPYEQHFIWIEGVGEKQWGLSATHFDDGSMGGMYVDNTSLLCVQQDNGLLYASPNGKEYGCELEKGERTTLDNISSGRITCSNVNGQYVIHIPESENIFSIFLYDSQGRSLLPAGYVRNALPSSLPSNMYMLIIKTNKRCYRTEILIP